MSVPVASNLPPACIQIMPPETHFVADWFRKWVKAFHIRLK
jgi:hypothetical protein